MKTNIGPLHWCALRDDIAAMRTILQHGAEVNLNTYYEKPLQQSAQRNLDTVRLLVEHGADDEERDYAWNTPLHMAAAGKTDVGAVFSGTLDRGQRGTQQSWEDTVVEV
jgi:ankyrin repeat protein